MKRALYLSLFVWALGGSAPASSQQAGVLCAWGIYVELSKIGETCRGDQDREFLDEVDASIERLNRFIIRNSETTAEELRKWRESASEAKPDMCKPGSDALELYESARDHYGSQGMKAEVDKIIAVDHVPSADPCL